MEKIKICRNCHSKYKNLDQKFCGNGCERQEPYLKDGEVNNEIESREILLSQNSDRTIKWICLGCQNNFDQDNLENNGWICPKCSKENDFYPFTEKSCSKCEDHILPLDAVSCDLCGTTIFTINSNKKTDDLKEMKKQTVQNEIFSEFLPKEISESEPKNKNVISCTFNVMNNNYQIILYAQEKEITLEEMIRNAPGFIPDSIYTSLIEKFTQKAPFFKLKFDVEKEVFSFWSLLTFEMIEVDPKYQPISNPIKWEKENEFSLPESKLLLLKGSFFKIQIWVY